MNTDAIPREIMEAIQRKLEPKGVLANIGVPNGLTLILYLDENSPVLRSKLYSDVSKSNRTMKRIQYLVDENLVDIVYSGRLNASFFVITVKGRAVAKYIRRLLDLSSRSPCRSFSLRSSLCPIHPTSLSDRVGNRRYFSNFVI